jgi:hypothetical protein
MGRLTAALAAIAIALVLAVPAASAADAADAEFGEPSATSTFGESVTFTQPVDLATPATRVEARVTFADARGPLVTELPAPSGTGSQTLRYSLEGPAGLGLAPNTPIRARFRVFHGADDRTGTDGPEIRTVYADDRFDWRTLSGDVLRIHWYDGDDAFGRRALEIGEEAVRNASEFLGVTEQAPLDFFIYAETGPFFDAIGTGSPENIIGQAHSDIRTMFGLVPPDTIDDARVRMLVPHELVHLVFNTAVDNPYHQPPTWLNEGLAVYLSEGYAADYRFIVEDAARNGTLYPLSALAGQFPRTTLISNLAYGEGVSAVDFLVRTYGEDTLSQLIRSYAEGRTDEEAFRDGTGLGVEAFGEAWLTDLGADEPRRYGPQPVPEGPKPPGWDDDGAPASPGAASPGASGSASPEPGPDGPAASGGPGPEVLVVVVLAVVGAALAAWTLRRRRAQGP